MLNSGGMIFGIPALLMVLRVFLPIKSRWLTGLFFLTSVLVFWGLLAVYHVRTEEEAIAQGFPEDTGANVAFVLGGWVWGLGYCRNPSVGHLAIKTGRRRRAEKTLAGSDCGPAAAKPSVSTQARVRGEGGGE